MQNKKRFWIENTKAERALEIEGVSINNLLVGVEQLWHIGIPLDIDFILDVYSKDGKTPIVIINLGEISSLEDRIFVVSRIAYAVYEWMRRKGGSGEPRLILYVEFLKFLFLSHS